METRYIVIVALTVAVSGCADSEIPNSNSNSQGQTTPVPQNGLQVSSLSVTDDTLQPNQEAIVNLELENYHTEEVTIENINVLNTGLLEKEYSSEEWQDNCRPNSLENARPGQDGSEPIIPEMECSWRISAPSEKEMGAFESRLESLSVQISYNSSIENRDELDLPFRPLSDIKSTETVTREFSNSEVSVSMETESPLSFQGGTMDFHVEGIGKGRVDGKYRFGYTPESVFVMETCPEEDEPVVGNDVEFTCSLEYDQEATRNIFFSTSYKYVKTPTLDVEVVKP